MLLLVCPLFSFAGNQWWKEWIKVRGELGLEVSGKLEFPLMCRFDAGGAPMKHSVSSREI